LEEEPKLKKWIEVKIAESWVLAGSPTKPWQVEEISLMHNTTSALRRSIG
jgi:hypothetical protein